VEEEGVLVIVSPDDALLGHIEFFKAGQPDPAGHPS